MLIALLETVLSQRCGTRPRLANSSTMRGITPGSASARIEKETGSGSEVRSETAAAADETDGGIAEILGRQWTKRRNPGPHRTRDANSADASAVRPDAHCCNLRPHKARVNRRAR